jgi:putative ABC transport system permease protein
VGRRFRFGGDDSTWVTVVGVVADVKQDELTDRLRPQLYLAVPQGPWRTLTLTVRTAGDAAALAPAVRRELRAFDADLPVSRLFTLDDVVRRRMFQPRVYSTMFFVFAASALLLATVGLYGVMAHAVAQRTHEIGVRVALGANARDVMRLVMRQGARLVIVGLVIGVPAAFALASVLRGALHGVSTRDPLTFIGIPLLLASVALLASYVPARRAMRVDPAEALRSE